MICARFDEGGGSCRLGAQDFKVGNVSLQFAVEDDSGQQNQLQTIGFTEFLSLRIVLWRVGERGRRWAKVGSNSPKFPPNRHPRLPLFAGLRKDLLAQLLFQISENIFHDLIREVKNK